MYKIYTNNKRTIVYYRNIIIEVLIPKDNVVDLNDVPEEIKDQLTIIGVETVEDVLRETLGISLPRIEHIFNPNKFIEGTFKPAE